MIKPLTLSKVAEATRGTLLGEDIAFSKVSIDSRSLESGELFVAIKGEQFDGHDYVESAIESGCGAVVVAGSIESSVPSLTVDDTQQALGEIGRLNREQFEGKLVGITGSSGKTTAKNLLASILSQAGKTLATKGNFNNEIGVPLTLLSIDSSHEFAVIEMGARQVGDIKYLGDFAKPDVAILLNVGNAHIDVFGSYENIVKAKSEIFETINDGGYVVFNADDPAAQGWIAKTKHLNVMRFSAEGNDAEVWADVIEYQQEYCRFNLCTNSGKVSVTIPMPGHHNVLNSLAAAAAALALGLSLSQIKDGLESAANDSGRLHAFDLTNGTRVIDDSYNANPASVKAALNVLSLYEGKKIAVLGEMAELGDFSERLHRQVAAHGADSDIEAFLLMGPYAEAMAQILGERAQLFSDRRSLADYLKQSLTGQETILIKGSRSAAMDEIVTQLKEANL